MAAMVMLLSLRKLATLLFVLSPLQALALRQATRESHRFLRTAELHELEQQDHLVVQSNASSVTRTPNIADIVRRGYKSWNAVYGGKVQFNGGEARSISAIPRNMPWTSLTKWNITYEIRKTKPIFEWNMKVGSKVKASLSLSLKYQYGGRVKFNSAYPRLDGKGRFLRDVRLIPRVKLSKSWTCDVQVKRAEASQTGKKTDPVAKVQLIVGISMRPLRGAGKKHASEWRITVLGKGGKTTIKRLS